VFQFSPDFTITRVGMPRDRIAGLYAVKVAAGPGAPVYSDVAPDGYAVIDFEMVDAAPLRRRRRGDGTPTASQPLC
jgi:hypothetical protein